MNNSEMVQALVCTWIVLCVCVCIQCTVAWLQMKVLVRGVDFSLSRQKNVLRARAKLGSLIRPEVHTRFD